jgi:epoxyqueuosine reductase QueG
MAFTMIKDIVERHLVPREEYISGFADLRGLLAEKYSGYNFGISIGKKLDDDIVDGLVSGPTLEYYRHYNEVNRELADLTARIGEDLSREGIDSLPVIPTISLGSKEYEKHLDSLSYDISHKMTATRAGLGWIGKTDLLISEAFGPRLRLVTILLEKDPGFTAKPVEKSKCGDCSICVSKCPANAANGIEWNVNTHRDLFFNAYKCREMCGKLAKQMLNADERICGLCVNICPKGKRKPEAV